MLLSLTAVFPLIFDFERQHSTNTGHNFAVLKIISLSNLCTTEKQRNTYLPLLLQDTWNLSWTYFCSKIRFHHLVPQSLAIPPCNASYQFFSSILVIGFKLPFCFLVGLHTEMITPPYYSSPHQPGLPHLFPHLQVTNLDMASACEYAFYFSGPGTCLSFISSLKPTNSLFNIKKLSINSHFW